MTNDPEHQNKAIMDAATAARHGMTPRAVKITRVMLAIPIINFLVSLASSVLGVSIISADTLQIIPFIPIRHELASMKYSGYYSQYADAYAGFMLVVMLLFVMSTTLLIIVFLRRIFVTLRLINDQVLESFSWFVTLLLVYFMGSYLWIFEWNSVFFNPNPKIGGNYYWFSTLLISITWMMVAPLSVLLALTPKFFSHSIFKDHPGLNK
ncbi:MAG: hypothetical protein L3J37_06640 [Rhodobacteraceae bacterium]|nr:hypothetical protein [Paracoccaceae bacterium]